MQVEANWKAAANLQLLLGDSHPPLRIEHHPIAPPRPPTGGRTQPEYEEAVKLHAAGGTALIDARNTANFRTTAYCGLQDPNTPAVRRRLISYYQEMLRRIPPWRNNASSGTGIKAEANVGQDGAVKRERSNDDGVSDDGAARETGTSNFRAVGILTQVHDPVGEQAVLPWEFFIVQDIDDDDCFDGPINALVKDIPQDRFPLLFQAVRTEASDKEKPDSAAMVASLQVGTADAESRLQQYAQEGQRLSLYAKMLGPFTGLYPGMAVGVIGDTFQRSARGILTGVLLRDVVLPSRPSLPWRIDRPLSAPPHAAGAAPSKLTRVHFCSGPFPRRDIQALLRAVTRQALHRGADLLIIGGPLVKPFEDFEMEILPSVTMPFSEMLDGFVDSLEETMAEYYAARPNTPHMKIILVSHPDDVTQVPVLPTTMYAMADSADVYFRSNPCRVAVNGVHFSVCNEDVVGHMRDVMVERWPTAEGSLRRVVEALVQSRTYTPVTSLPMTRVDMKSMPQLRMDYMPSANELLELEKGPGSDAHRLAVLYANSNWNAVCQLDGDCITKDEADADADRKRVKTEAGDGSAAQSIGDEKTNRGATEEYLPHIMFLPSTRPQFAYVTHRSVPVSRSERSLNHKEMTDESDLDDVTNATGILVVNQEVWSRRSSPKFELRVAEVTINDSSVVARRGASAANGVACGVLHIYNAERT